MTLVINKTQSPRNHLEVQRSTSVPFKEPLWERIWLFFSQEAKRSTFTYNQATCFPEDLWFLEEPDDRVDMGTQGTQAEPWGHCPGLLGLDSPRHLDTVKLSQGFKTDATQNLKKKKKKVS